MNQKVINFFEPKTFEGVKLYWAWKAVDLRRTVDILNNFLKDDRLENRGDVLETRMKKISELRLIESMQKRHKEGEF